MKRFAPAFLSLLLCFVPTAWASPQGAQGWMGVRLGASSGQQGTAKGVYVLKVCEDGPADAAGLQAGDLILSLDGLAVNDARSFARKIQALAPGHSVRLDLQRKGKSMAVNVVTGTRPEDGGASCLRLPDFRHGMPERLIRPIKTCSTTMGVGLQEMTPDLRDYFGAPRENGVLVSRVKAGSPADKAGVQVGDVFVEFDGKPVRNSWDIHSAVHAKKAGDEVSLLVYRRKRPKNMVLTLEAGEKLRYDLGGLLNGNYACPGGLCNKGQVWHWDDQAFNESMKKFQKYFQSKDFQSRVRSYAFQQKALEGKIKLLEKKLQNLEKQFQGQKDAPSHPL